MAFLKKLFKKKDSLESLEKDLSRPLDKNLDFENDFGSTKTTFGEQSSHEMSAPPVMQSAPLNETRLDSNGDLLIKKDMEIISSKLDAIKSSLESLNQRVENIERIAMEENED